jgi:hypothetical protein
LEISSDLTAHKYAFAIPCYEGKIQTETALSLLETSGKLGMMKINHAHIVIRGGALIADVRNEMTHRFLHLTDCDTMICIDADIQWDWDSMLRLMTLSAHYPILGGVYQSRVEPVKFIVNNTKSKLNEHGLLETNGMGMGFVAIQRRVFEEMKVPDYDVDNYPQPIKQFFQTGIQDRKPVGEDVWFFREAYKQGFPCWVDPGINLIHHGSKMYSEKFQDYVHQVLDKDETLGE